MHIIGFYGNLGRYKDEIDRTVFKEAEYNKHSEF